MRDNVESTRARTPSLSAIPPDTLHFLRRGAPPRKDSRNKRHRSREASLSRPLSPLRNKPVTSSEREEPCGSRRQYTLSDGDECRSDVPDHICTESWRKSCHYCVQTKLLNDLHEEIARVSSKAMEAERMHDGKSIGGLLARLDELSGRLERIFERDSSSEHSLELEKPPVLPPLDLPPTDEGLWVF